MRCSYCNDQIHKLTRATFIACPCKQTNYCDQVCQKADWGKGGHKERCEYFAKIVDRKQAKQKRHEKLRQQAMPNGGPEVTSKRVNDSKSVNRHESESVVNLDRSKRPNPMQIENSQEFAEEEGFASRDSFGRFVQCDSDITQAEKYHGRVNTANYKDFKAARGRLQSIIDRNKKIGVKWAFKIACNKSAKWAHQGSHQWESENYAEKSESDSEDEDENDQPRKVVQRVCKNCKNQVTGPQWSYLVCAGVGCRNGLTHFSCIGFPDISVQLAAAMRKEYLCKACHRNLEEIENQAADFAMEEDPSRKKRNRKIKPVTLKDRLKVSKKSRRKNGSVPTLSEHTSPEDDGAPHNDFLRSSPSSFGLRILAAPLSRRSAQAARSPQAKKSAVRSPQAMRSAVKGPQAKRSAARSPKDKRSAASAPQEKRSAASSPRGKISAARSPQGKRSAARSEAPRAAARSEAPRSAAGSEAPRSAARSNQTRRFGVELHQAKSLPARRSAFQLPDNRRCDDQSTAGDDYYFSTDNNCNVPVGDSPPFDESDEDFIK